jgi:hypothetical protein
VEDEWEREMESEEDLDLLFVSFKPQQVSLDLMLETIRGHGFEVEVKSEN